MLDHPWGVLVPSGFLWLVSVNVDAHRRAGAGSLSHLFIGCAGSQVLHGLFPSCSVQDSIPSLRCVSFSLQWLL